MGEFGALPGEEREERGDLEVPQIVFSLHRLCHHYHDDDHDDDHDNDHDDHDDVYDDHDDDEDNYYCPVDNNNYNNLWKADRGSSWNLLSQLVLRE